MSDGSFLQSEYGNLASVAGLALTIVGFLVTWRKQKKLREATEAAQQEARRTVQSFAEKIAHDDVSLAAALAQELQHETRNRHWESAIDRAERLRNRLGRMVISHRLTDDERAFLQSAGDDASLMLEAVERLRGSVDGRMQPQALKRLEALIRQLNAIDGRLRNAQLDEVRNG